MPPDPPTGYIQFERLLALALPGLLVVACLIVIAPFAAALLWAAVIVVSVWRPLEWLTARLGGRRGLVGSLLTVTTLAVIVGPAVALGDAAVSAIPELRAMAGDLGAAARTHGPALLAQLPLVGERAAAAWTALVEDVGPLVDALGALAPEIGGWLARQTLALGVTVLQLLLVALGTGVMYARGPAGAQLVGRLAERIGGAEGTETLDVAVRAIRAVSTGVVGTAAVQAVLAWLGFALAGVPAPFALSIGVLVLGIVQIGPLPVWLPVVVWMFATSDDTLANVLLLIWSAGVVQTVDNVLRPLLISRGARLPLLLMLVGVLGGLISMGLIGVFLGPTILGVGYVLLRRWLGLEPIPIAPSASG
ncbi:AI-2E family transporter [Elioraea sp.]|uniref:AI-2E family transporter n=1 Tax=Elioraea sp. TaxID=2185103 RepID=UPI003F7265CF